MTIKKLPSTERPYEKAQMYGIENLSNSELLAIIIKTGTKEKTSVQLAQEILSIESKNKKIFSSKYSYKIIVITNNAFLFSLNKEIMSKVLDFGFIIFPLTS